MKISASEIVARHNLLMRSQDFQFFADQLRERAKTDERLLLVIGCKERIADRITGETVPKDGKDVGITLACDHIADSIVWRAIADVFQRESDRLLQEAQN